MPVQLPNALGLNDNPRARNRLRDGEIGRIDLPPLTATTWRGLRRVLEGAVHIARVAGQFTISTRDGVIRALLRRRVQDIRVRARDASKH